MRNTTSLLTTALAVALTLAPGLEAQEPRPADVASPEAIVSAAYEAIARPPGGDFDWPRFRSLFLPQAHLIPSTEQTGGPLVVMSVDDFVDWIDAGTTVGGVNDAGFSEDGIHNVAERYGDIAHVFSTYEKHLYGQTENQGRGINTFQMIWNAGRWWITSIAWDEEIGAGPIPAKYLP
jgi:hypothetical protein